MLTTDSSMKAMDDAKIVPTSTQTLSWAPSLFLRPHPEAEFFAGLKVFAFSRPEITKAHLVAGFGRIADLKPADILADVSDAQPLLEATDDAIAHMNADHAEACRLYA